MKLMKIVIDTLPGIDVNNFAMTVNQYEFNLIVMALDEFRLDPIYE